MNGNKSLRRVYIRVKVSPRHCIGVCSVDDVSDDHEINNNGTEQKKGGTPFHVLSDKTGAHSGVMQGMNYIRGSSNSLYPSVLTETIESLRSGTFNFTRRTWTSTVRVVP
jgi:hypothetical protein